MVFLYGEVLNQPLGELVEFARANRPPRMPVVLSREEVQAVFEAADASSLLPLKLLYGSGLRLFELLRLRVKDVDLARRQITVRDGKGAKDRITMVPESLREPLEGQLATIQTLHAQDQARGYYGVWLPDALARKYPSAPREWAWQWLFPAHSLTTVRTVTGEVEFWRHHMLPELLQRAMKAAGRRAGLRKPATPHSLRNAST